MTRDTTRTRRWRGDTGRVHRGYVFATAVTILLVAAGGSLLARARPPVVQPVPFSHLKHTQELQLGCDFCHKYVRTGAHSGLPGAETCSICHSAPQGDSEEAARLTELLGAGEPLQFTKLFRLPDHVFYTHRRHVAIGEIACETCHGGIAETERPPTRPLVDIGMSFCVDCHLERDVTDDCTACHR